MTLRNIVWNISQAPQPALKKSLVYSNFERTIGDLNTRVRVRGGHTKAGCMDETEFNAPVFTQRSSVKLVLFYKDDGSTYSKDYTLDFDAPITSVATLLYRIHALYRQRSPINTSFRYEIFRGLEYEGEDENGVQLYSVVFA